MNKEMEKLRAQLQEKEEESARIKKELEIANMQKKKPAKGPGKRKKKLTAEESQWHTAINKAIKMSLWGFIIFINTDSRLLNACKCVMKDMQLTCLTKIKEERERKEAESNWITDNWELIRTLMNNQRNYAQSQIRITMQDLMFHGNDHPNIDDVEKCAFRDKDYLDTERGQKMFDFYWDVLLRRIGGREHWNDRLRLNNTIQEAMHPPSPGHRNPYPCIGVELEAFLVLVFHNCYNKWSQVIKNKTEALQKGKEPEQYDPKADYANCPYTEHLEGKCSWGGWNDAGRKLFRDIRDKIKAAKEEDHVLEYEKAALLRIRYVVDVYFVMVFG